MEHCEGDGAVLLVVVAALVAGRRACTSVEGGAAGRHVSLLLEALVGEVARLVAIEASALDVGAVVVTGAVVEAVFMAEAVVEAVVMVEEHAFRPTLGTNRVSSLLQSC